MLIWYRVEPYRWIVHSFDRSFQSLVAHQFQTDLLTWAESPQIEQKANRCSYYRILYRFGLIHR